MDRTLHNLLASRKDSRGTEDPENVWNVFVQILLPLIIVLTFCAILSVLKYQDYAEGQRKIAQGALDEIGRLRSSDIGEVNQKYKITLFELQQQLLLRAMDEVKFAIRQEMLLDRFENYANRSQFRPIKVEVTKIEDKEFQTLCGRTHSALSNHDAFRNEIYRKVLELSRIEDPDGVIMPRSKWSPDEIGGTEPEGIAIRREVIDRRNRYYIHNLIHDFVSSLEMDIVRIQTGALLQIFENLLTQTEQPDSRSRELVRRILDAGTPDEERTRLVNDFYRRITDSVRRTNADYPFLDATWDQIKSL